MTLLDDLAELRTYADKGPSVSRAACRRVADAALWAGPAAELFDPQVLGLPADARVLVSVEAP